MVNFEARQEMVINTGAVHDRIKEWPAKLKDLVRHATPPLKMAEEVAVVKTEPMRDDQNDLLGGVKYATDELIKEYEKSGKMIPHDLEEITE